MRNVWTVLVAGALLLATAACGSDSGSNDATSGGTDTTMHDHGAGSGACSPSGTSISIEALPNAKLAWDKDCLAVPAGKDIKVTFDNEDAGIPHSFAVLMSHESSQVFYSTGQTTGPLKKDFTIPADKLPGPGTYHFHCEVHPNQMMGTFIIQ